MGMRSNGVANTIHVSGKYVFIRRQGIDVRVVLEGELPSDGNFFVVGETGKVHGGAAEIPLGIRRRPEEQGHSVLGAALLPGAAGGGRGHARPRSVSTPSTRLLSSLRKLEKSSPVTNDAASLTRKRIG